MGTDKRTRQKEGRGTRLEQARRDAAAVQRRRRVVNLALLVGVVVVAIIALAVFNSDDDKSPTASGSTTTLAPDTPTPCPATDGSTPKQQSFAAPPDMCIDASKQYTARIDTTSGAFTVQLDPAKAPNTVNNFVVLARYKFYDGVVFHRIIPDFVIQGGDPKGDGTGGPGYKFPDELPQPSDYVEGSIVMANSGPDTNGSQFFVVLSANGAKTLVDAVGGEAKYSLFGKVTEGMDVVTAISAVPLDGETPKEPVTINSVTITET